VFFGGLATRISSMSYLLANKRRVRVLRPEQYHCM